MSGLGLRLLTSLIAIPLLIALIGWVPWYGFSTLVWAGITLAFYELFALLLVDETASFRWNIITLGSATIAGMILLWRPPTAYHLFYSPPGFWVIFLMLMIVAMIMLVSRGGSGDLSAAPKHMTAVFFGLVYLSVCGVHIAYLARLPDGLSVGHQGWAFLGLGGTFMTDTGGYFFGKGIGGPKLAPSISPKKTWAGLVGCAVGGTAGAFIAQAILIPSLLWYDCVIIGLAFAIFGQLGDFFISMLKRASQVKDTGSILPGHGGLLDRIDSLLFTGPFIFYYAVWFVLPRGLPH